MKNILYTLLCILTLFIPTSFAQQNLQEEEWTSSSTVLPALEDGKDGYYVYGDLAGRYNYFLKGENSQANAKNYYIEFGKFTNSSSTVPRIYLGETGATSASYYGDLTAVFTDEITSGIYYAGSNNSKSTYFGNIKTIFTGNVNFTSTVYGGAYTPKSATVSEKSTALEIKNGTFSSAIYGDGYVGSSAKFNNSEGTYISVTNATLSGTGRIAAGANVQGGTYVNNGGTRFYLGSGAKLENINHILGGSYVASTGSSSKITGGTSVEIDGATIGSATKTAYIYGGAEVIGSKGFPTSTIDTTKVTVSAGELNANIYGGSFVQSRGESVIGNTFVEINGAEITGNVFGGSSYSENYYETVLDPLHITGATSVKITGGTITGDVFGGSSLEAITDMVKDEVHYYYTKKSNIVGGTNVEISGGTITGNVYGASKLHADGPTNSSSTTDGDVNINISGGTITGNVVAGTYAIKGNSVGEEFGATVSSAKVVVSGGTIGGNIIASGDGADSIIEGNSEIVFIGNGDDINFKGTVIGASNSSKVNGDTIVSFGEGENAFIGTFKGKVSAMDAIEVNSISEVSFANYVSTWSLIVQDGAKVNITEATNFRILTIAFNEEFGENSTFGFDMSEMFGDSTSIVLSKIEGASLLTVQNSDGTKYEALYSDGVIEVGSVYVPEPSTYAAIFGAIALAFVAYRRRK